MNPAVTVWVNDMGRSFGVGCETRLWTDEKKPTCFDTCRLVVKAKRQLWPWPFEIAIAQHCGQGDDGQEGKL